MPGVEHNLLPGRVYRLVPDSSIKGVVDKKAMCVHFVQNFQTCQQYLFAHVATGTGCMMSFMPAGSIFAEASKTLMNLVLAKVSYTFKGFVDEQNIGSLEHDVKRTIHKATCKND